MQVNVYVPFAVNAVRISLPEIALLPVHAPDALHAAALVLDHVNVVGLLYVTLVGFADSDMVGAAGAWTVTVTDWLVVPPPPEQVKT